MKLRGFLKVHLLIPVIYDSYDFSSLKSSRTISYNYDVFLTICYHCYLLPVKTCHDMFWKYCVINVHRYNIKHVMYILCQHVFVVNIYHGKC